MTESPLRPGLDGDLGRRDATGISVDRQLFMDLYRAMLTAREIDRLELELTNRGEAFFHVSGAGHEASVALFPYLIAEDYLHCHYRDKALMIARGLSAKDFFDALFCKQASHSRGRQMSAHMSHRSLNLLSIVGPVGNSCLQAVGVAAAIKPQASRPIVLCSVGDGTTQEGEFLEAVAEAVRSRLPVLFFVEDNHYAISTTTPGKTFYSLPKGWPNEFYGLPIHRLDGRDPVLAREALGPIVSQMREDRGPSLLIFDVERLANHTNADDQTLYRTEEDIRRASDISDPLRVMESYLLKSGATPEDLQAMREQVAASVAKAEAEAASGPEPEAIHVAKKPLPADLTLVSREFRGSPEGRELVMRDAICQVLGHHLRTDPRVTLFGQDIEDPKGDVFGVTKGLTNEFGERVKNAPLSESTIVGVSIGRALAGELPVAFLQFADFLPLAYNQIISELGSMYWRTDGQWQAPVIIMIACGAYRPGLGPFHAQTLESVAAHTPGVDVFMPSTAADAAGLLNAAFQSGRPTLFFYPKSCLNDPDQATSADVASQFVPIGTARKVTSGRDLTLVTWGNTLRLSQQAVDKLEEAGVEAELIDLRSLSPWDEHAILTSTEKTGRLLVVHEDNHTCGMGAEIMATVAERSRKPVAMRRITRADTYVPCNFGNQIEVLPSFKGILTAAAEMLDLDLTWAEPPKAEKGIALVEAIGSGPSDERVQVVELHVKAGQPIQRGDIVASLEATKSTFDLTSPVSGLVESVLAGPGDTVAVGAPLLKVRTEETSGRVKPIKQEQPGIPVLKRSRSHARPRKAARETVHRAFDVGMSSVATVEGGRLVTNADLFNGAFSSRGKRFNSGGMTEADISRLTGIEQRRWAQEQEDAVSIAARACWQLLDRENLRPDDLDLLICSTTTPNVVTPSMACQVLAGLSRGKSAAHVQAHDVSAACSGYLYALQAGYDYLQGDPSARVLVVTTEVLSPLLDPEDFDTAILFADAASATILYGAEHYAKSVARLYRPSLSAKADTTKTLSVPFPGDGFIQMKGRKVFSEAVRSMVTSLTRVCQREGIGIDQLQMVVPHQANQRIMDAIQSRIGVKVYSNISQHGNTSSTSIPLCLSELLPQAKPGDRLGLCAFGGGFTFGATIVEALTPAA